MTCRDLERRIAEGEPFSAEEKSHLAACPGCGALVEAFTDLQADAAAQFPQASLPQLPFPIQAVRPLPSDGTLVALALGGFVAFCMLVASLIGMRGYQALSVPQRMIYLTAIAAGGALLAAAAVQTGIPGAKVRIRPAVAITLPLLLVAGVVCILFRNFSLQRFVAAGVPCLRLGCICSALFAALATLALRRGYVTDFVRASVLLACLAGFAGAGVLSLYCPLQDSAHILVWHLGTVFASGGAGFLLGTLLSANR